MKLKQAFNQLAYQLIYPAVLGSIIFDLADPFRVMSEARIVGFLICLCFVVDYLHMTLNLCKDGASPHKYGAAIDILIALLFCLSYFSLSRTTVPEFDPDLLKTYLLYSLGYIFLTHLVILIYEMPMKGAINFNVIEYIPLSVSFSGLILLFYRPIEDSLHILFVSLLIILVAYTYKVVKPSYDSNKEGHLDI
jgi:hypothetical protein